MLIDDDEVNNFVFSKLFKHSRVEAALRIFTNGHQAFLELKKLRANSLDLPKVIIVDMKMPIMGGLEFIERFKEQFKRDFPFVKVLVLTAALSSEDKKRLMHFVAPENILFKPVQMEQLKGIMLAS